MLSVRLLVDSKLLAVKFWQSKVTCRFSTAWYVSTPNPCIAQGSTASYIFKKMAILWFFSKEKNCKTLCLLDRYFLIIYTLPPTYSCQNSDEILKPTANPDILVLLPLIHNAFNICKHMDGKTEGAWMYYKETWLLQR